MTWHLGAIDGPVHRTLDAWMAFEVPFDGPGRPWTGFAPSPIARFIASAASATRKAMAQAEGPWTRAKAWAKLSGSPLTRKLTPPCRHSVTSFERWRATGRKPSWRNSRPSAAGSGAAYSMNSNPSVPIGFSQRSRAGDTPGICVVSPTFTSRMHGKLDEIV